MTEETDTTWDEFITDKKYRCPFSTHTACTHMPKEECTEDCKHLTKNIQAIILSGATVTDIPFNGVNTQIIINDKHESQPIKVLKELSEYTDEEKIAFFDKCHTFAKEELEEYEEERIEPKDTMYRGWEMIMSLLGKDVWVRWNAIDPKAER